MPYPRSNLNPGEEIVLDLSPHWIFFAEPAALTGGLLVVLIFVAAKAWSQYLTLIVVVGVLVAAVWVGVRYVKWIRTHFVVTTDRVIYREGVVSRHGVEIPLERIMNVNFHQRLIERTVGAGDLTIESGGRDGQTRFSDVRKPEIVQNIIHQQADINREKGSGRTQAQNRAAAEASKLPPPAPGADAPAPPAGSASSADDVAATLTRLNELKEQGVLTQAEFDEQKAKLLGRL